MDVRRNTPGQGRNMNKNASISYSDHGPTSVSVLKEVPRRAVEKSKESSSQTTVRQTWV
jgi:hypothetical protein